MSRRLVVVTAMLLAACGTGPSSSNGTDTGGPSGAITGVGSLGVRALSASTKWLKVVVRTTQLVPQQILIGEYGDQTVPCTGDTVATACSGYGSVTQPVFCANATTGSQVTGTNPGVCTVNNSVNALMYATDIANPTATSTFSVPCNGQLYSVELYGVAAYDSTAKIYKMTEGHKTQQSFKMNSACNGVDISTPLTWTDWVASAPGLAGTTTGTFPAELAFNFPAYVYAGGSAMGAKYANYVVTVPGLGSPWSPTWTVTDGTNNPTPAGAGATFPAPNAGVTSVTITGTFHLDPSLVTSAANLGDWRLNATSTKTTVQTGTITVP